MKPRPKKRPTPRRKTAQKTAATYPPAAVQTGKTAQTSETNQTRRPKPKVPYEEPLPFIPYRPVPVSAALRRLTEAETHTPDRARVDAVLNQANDAAVALRQIVGPDYNTEVSIRARLNSLANHLEEVARYINRAYR